MTLDAEKSLSSPKDQHTLRRSPRFRQKLLLNAPWAVWQGNKMTHLSSLV